MFRGCFCCFTSAETGLLKQAETELLKQHGTEGSMSEIHERFADASIACAHCDNVLGCQDVGRSAKEPRGVNAYTCGKCNGATVAVLDLTMKLGSPVSMGVRSYRADPTRYMLLVHKQLRAPITERDVLDCIEDERSYDDSI